MNGYLLDNVRSDLQSADDLAREDMRLAKQAAAEIEETQRAIRKAKTYYKLGE